ncbi:MAG: DUF5615 family PIN-like protein [Cyanobacteria bacterium J06642_9]
MVRGLLLRHPNLDLLQAQDVGLREVDDPAMLAWAASNGCILLIHDRQASKFLWIESQRLIVIWCKFVRNDNHSQFFIAFVLSMLSPRTVSHG